ncbi:hypothetical protein FRZ67_12795 [Panacibacter ginsenosidivorans]|uniref:Uncharacterized protein n=1 Tax=Panacibacter ginsenosidivorans TaxID=1813871 RepID=A0A5B8VAI4_9BACT|nr:hypothetical protein [Panacibacter ginsenosidivorans]QEC68135.1 hypothetical protein FRZ67_12795 [Panacibacter ginsenosidivorans]
MLKSGLFLLAFYLLSCGTNRQQLITFSALDDTSLKIFTTGIPDLEAITQMNFLAKSYGFKYSPIGCVVTKTTMDSVQKANDSAYKILEKRFGKEWKTNFYSQFDTINQIRQYADSVFISQVKNNEKYFYYLVMPDSINKQYKIKLYSKDSLNSKSELIVHYIMTITLKQKLKANIYKIVEKL